MVGLTTEEAIDRSLQVYYENGGKRFTQDEALYTLRRIRRVCFPKPEGIWRHYRGYEWELRIQTRFLIGEFCKRIERAHDLSDPLRVIYSFIYDMDDIVAESDIPLTWCFARTSIKASEEILDRIKTMYGTERRAYHEKNRPERSAEIRGART